MLYVVNINVSKLKIIYILRNSYFIFYRELLI